MYVLPTRTITHNINTYILASAYANDMQTMRQRIIRHIPTVWPEDKSLPIKFPKRCIRNLNLSVTSLSEEHNLIKCLKFKENGNYSHPK